MWGKKYSLRCFEHLFDTKDLGDKTNLGVSGVVHLSSDLVLVTLGNSVPYSTKLPPSTVHSVCFIVIGWWLVVWKIFSILCRAGTGSDGEKGMFVSSIISIRD